MIPTGVALIATAALSVLALAAALCALGYAWWQVRQLRGQCQALQRQLAVSDNAARGLGQRLLAMEKQGATASAPVESESDYSDYSQATELLRLGLEREEVAQRCGLSLAEVSLIDTMRRQPPSGGHRVA